MESLLKYNQSLLKQKWMSKQYEKFSRYLRYFFNLKVMKILITGGSGYLGSVITEKLLNEDYQVTILDNLMYNQTSSIIFSHNPNFNFIYMEMLEIKHY